VHGEEESLENMAGLLREQLGLDVYIPSYLEEISLVPLGRHLDPSQEFSARLKAQQIINMWEENISNFRTRLFSYLEEEKDLERLVSLEERLGFIIRQLEEEKSSFRSLPLLFAPSGEEDNRDGGVKEAS